MTGRRSVRRSSFSPAGEFWVIGGCWGDETQAWRRWSEVIGPFVEREPAEAKRRELAEIFARDARVHFEVVWRDEASG